MTTPCSAKALPSYQRWSAEVGTMSAADPVVKPPPWIHTITGAPGSLLLGRQTFRYRQSSSVLAGDCCEGGCGHGLANSVSCRTSSHGSAVCGAFQRSAPTGGFAYGIFRKR